MNLFLSRLILNLHSRQVMSELAHPYEMHRTLMRAFHGAAEAESGAREQFGVLFRADSNERQDLVKVLVQSLVEPDWSFLHRLDGYLSDSVDQDAVSCRDILPAYQKLRGGQLLTFRVRANPTKRVAKEGDPLKGKRVDLQREEEQVAWLIRKGQEREPGVPGGFELLMTEGEDEKGEERLVARVQARREGKQFGRKRDGVQGHTMTHMAVVFDGFLRVVDAGAFIETLTRGIGSGKAYGFGLLSVSPARE